MSCPKVCSFQLPKVCSFQLPKMSSFQLPLTQVRIARSADMPTDVFYHVTGAG